MLNIGKEDEISRSDILFNPNYIKANGNVYINLAFLHDLVPSEKLRQCIQCSYNKNKKRTTYICKQCEINLCTKCHGTYHKRLLQDKKFLIN